MGATPLLTGFKAYSTSECVYNSVVYNLQKTNFFYFRPHPSPFLCCLPFGEWFGGGLELGGLAALCDLSLRDLSRHHPTLCSDSIALLTHFPCWRSSSDGRPPLDVPRSDGVSARLGSPSLRVSFSCGNRFLLPTRVRCVRLYRFASDSPLSAESEWSMVLYNPVHMVVRRKSIRRKIERIHIPAIRPLTFGRTTTRAQHAKATTLRRARHESCTRRPCRSTT